MHAFWFLWHRPQQYAFSANFHSFVQRVDPEKKEVRASLVCDTCLAKTSNHDFCPSPILGYNGRGISFKQASISCHASKVPNQYKNRLFQIQYRDLNANLLLSGLRESSLLDYLSMRATETKLFDYEGGISPANYFIDHKSMKWSGCKIKYAEDF